MNGNVDIYGLLRLNMGAFSALTKDNKYKTNF